MALPAPTSVVSIGSVGFDAGQLELHGMVNGRPVDTFPPDPSAFLALADVSSQQAYVAETLASAAFNYPQATVLALKTATALTVTGAGVTSATGPVAITLASPVTLPLASPVTGPLPSPVATPVASVVVLPIASGPVIAPGV